MSVVGVAYNWNPESKSVGWMFVIMYFPVMWNKLMRGLWVDN
jgi:hypothetical protein